MKKYTNKKKTAITIAFMGILGLCAVMGMSQKEYKSTYASVDPSTPAVVYTDEDYEITLSVNELLYSWGNLYTYLNSDGFDIVELSTNNLSYTFDTSDEGVAMYITSSSESVVDIGFLYNYEVYDAEPYHYNYYFFNYTNDVAYEHDITLVSDSGHYDDLKSAIELDIQANQPGSQGDSIITAITSGLGLAPDVANEFVKGFTAVFWDSTNSSLTRVSNFMLVMLGIAIVMAIIKLSLSLIRSNTGV